MAIIVKPFSSIYNKQYCLLIPLDQPCWKSTMVSDIEKQENKK